MWAFVDRAAAFELLPGVYARALRLRDDGCGAAEIARQLRIAPEAVQSTLELAEAKLARLAEHDRDREEPRAQPGGSVVAPPKVP
jgi:DNA-directed RNA polymerase specialized sigma24 family protein